MMMIHDMSLMLMRVTRRLGRLACRAMPGDEGASSRAAREKIRRRDYMPTLIDTFSR